MDIQPTSVSAIVTPAAAPSPAPNVVPDQRASADVAAATRNPRPDLPLPIPPSNSQQAVVSTAMIDNSEHNGDHQVKEIERVLKPYGVAMLPERATDQAPDQSADQDQPEDEPRNVAEKRDQDTAKSAEKREPDRAEPREIERDSAPMIRAEEAKSDKET